MSRFPIEYAVELQKSDSEPMKITAGHRPLLVVGAPPEFGGNDTWWSPEHLLVSALGSCMTATFYALAERAGVRVGTYRCRAHGNLDRREGTVSFVSMLLRVDMTVLVGDVERVRALVDEAKTKCFVASSLRCPVEVTAEITAS